MSLGLINGLQKYYQGSEIDLLVNDDTYSLASLFPNIHHVYKFSYEKKKNNQWAQEKSLISSIFRKYDLSINLTASDRSVIYGIIASKFSISAIEKNKKKSWWKSILLSNYYYFDNSKHILLNNLKSLDILKINHEKISPIIEPSKKTMNRVKSDLEKKGIEDFLIFHPSAQYGYKIYPKNLRNELLRLLDGLNIPIIITGSDNEIDRNISMEIQQTDNLLNYIGKTSLEEFIAISKLSMAYVGMDTLNMHIAASQQKRIFAIFGPTILSMWSPWSSSLKISAIQNLPIQNYGEITIFQANMPCVACGKAGCCNNHGKSECLDHISPNEVYKEIEVWYKSARI
jgi:heptosyltransferase III